MPLSFAQIQNLASALQNEIKGTYLQGFNEFDQDSYFWILSDKRKLVFCLSSSFPRVYLGGASLTQTSLNTVFASTMRKLLSHARVLEVHAEPNERILYFELERTNEVYKKEKVTLVFEMLPAKPRLLLLDDNKKIIISTHYASLESKRPLLRNMVYTLPEKGNFTPKLGEPFDYEAYQQKCLEEENSLLQARKKTRFKETYRLVKNRLKTAQRKIAAIEKDIEEAKLHEGDAIYGDAIYTDFASFHKGDESFLYEGKVIPLDPKKSPQENAAAFYKRAKKAKVTLEQSSLHLQEAKEEAENALTLLSLLDTLDGAALEELGPSLGLLSNGKEKKIQGTALLPYEVKDGKTRILFGKNAKQNDFLSFLYSSDKDLLWFHILQGPGAHAILYSVNPSKEEISLACQIALLASSKTMGEIMYTEKKNIKRGSYPGQAIVKTFQSAYFPSVSEKAKALYETAVKIRLAPRKEN